MFGGKGFELMRSRITKQLSDKAVVRPKHPLAQTSGSPKYDHRSRIARIAPFLGAQVRHPRIVDAGSKSKS
jgi:hypothetical protein